MYQTQQITRCESKVSNFHYTSESVVVNKIANRVSWMHHSQKNKLPLRQILDGN